MSRAMGRMIWWSWSTTAFWCTRRSEERDAVGMLFSGARVCDPQQRANSRCANPFRVLFEQGSGCGSQTRAPLNTYGCKAVAEYPKQSSHGCEAVADLHIQSSTAPSKQ